MALSSPALDFAIALDPALVFERMGMTPDPWQAALLRSTSDRVLLNIHRQSGKSTTVGAVAAHTAVYQENQTILLLSPTLRQSGLLFKKCMQAYKALDQPIPPVVENRLSLELANGSEIVALPGNKEDNIRGFSKVNLMVIDEAAYVDEGLFTTLRPMLIISRGRLMGLSTPGGTEGWFFDEWHANLTDPKDRWERYKVVATECPRITEEDLDEERRKLGPWFNQEYMCEFMESDRQVFTREDVARAIRPDVEAWDLSK